VALGNWLSRHVATNLTAGPDHDGGSSDPMIPKAVIRTDHFAHRQSDVLSRNRTHDGSRAIMVGLRTETDPA
jgi:hypothetical protein